MNWESIFVKAGWVAIALLALPLLSLLSGPLLHARATPPARVTNLVSFLEWQPAPMRVMRVTVGTNLYWQAFGPAGRSGASGLSAYSFDSSGKFIGWTPDSGDLYRPPHLYGPDAKREMAALSDLKTPLRQPESRLTE